MRIRIMELYCMGLQKLTPMQKSWQMHVKS